MSRSARPVRARTVRSRRGSASAVVVLVTVLLAVFGVLALVSSYSGYKLAKRHADWTTAYYSVDAQAVSFLADVESSLAAAAGEAGSVSAAGAYPDLAETAMALRVPEEGGAVLRDADGLTVRALIGRPGGQYVRMELRVGFSDGPIPDRFCRIVSWRQWQKPFAYDENPGDIWGGES